MAFNKGPQKDGRRSHCKECRRKYRQIPENKEYIAAHNKEYREKNKDKIRAKKKKYWEANREKLCLHKRRYWHLNRDVINAKNRERHRLNPEKYRAQVSQWQKENREWCNSYGKKWRKENHDKVIANSRKQEKLRSKELRNSYVRKLLRLNTNLVPSDIPQELIEFKRAHIKLGRLLKGAKDESKDNQRVKGTISRNI